MHIVLIIVVGLLGAVIQEVPGFIMGCLIGYLTAEVISLRRRVTDLEQHHQMEAITGAEEVEFFLNDAEDRSPVTSSETATVQPPFKDKEKIPAAEPIYHSEQVTAAAESQKPESWIDKIFSVIGDSGAEFSGYIHRFFTGGNLVLKVGIIILFFGVAFLLKYAAQQDLVPLELRLAAAAMGGLVLLVAGWYWRHRVLGYGLGLQGGGIGILYLVVYAAAKLYQFLPMPLALGLMIALVALSGTLAVLQDSKGLAIFGLVGGFLAPVLMSTGTGSHVMLFSYYALLNCGILGIAWYKAWRELNLLGFFFTFAIATLWGSSAYQPAYFSTTEPFLILFFLFYVSVSVLYAHRQPLELRGFIDGPLVFGLPLVASGLQYSLVRDYEYGMAISSLVLALFYLVLATLLWRRLAEGMRMVCEAFLALGIVFGTLAVPLALDGNWTTATWALEGAAMVWVGVRQQRRLARIFALMLQIGAAYTFLDSVWYPFGAMAFINRYFFGCLFIAMAALFSSYYLDRHRQKLQKWELYLPVPLLVWGLCWWYYGGLREVDRHFAHLENYNVMLLFSCASTVLLSIIAKALPWRQLATAQLLLLPVMVVCSLIGLLEISGRSHLMAEWGGLVWGVAFFTQYRLLHLFDRLWPQRWAGYWHVATFWFVLAFINHEAAWLTAEFFNLSHTWAYICRGVLPAGVCFVLMRWGRRLAWPVGQFAGSYLGPGVSVPAIALVLWCVASLRLAGNPAPIAYLPVVNPLELSLLFVILALLYWVLACRRNRCHLPAVISIQPLFWLVAALGFLWLNGIVARATHFYAGIPYYFESLYYSVIFQAAIAALWSLTALTVTIWATRIASRQIWCAGAALLGLVVAKLFLVDLSGTGTVARIVSFLVVGVLMLVIGYFSPMPPKKEEVSA